MHSLSTGSLTLPLKWQNDEVHCLGNISSNKLWSIFLNWLLFLNVLLSFDRSLKGVPKNSPWNMICSLSFLEKAMAPHSSTLAWKIPWTEEPGRLQSMGLQRVRYDWGRKGLQTGEWHVVFLQQGLWEIYMDIELNLSVIWISTTLES